MSIDPLDVQPDSRRPALALAKPPEACYSCMHTAVQQVTMDSIQPLLPQAIICLQGRWPP